MRRRGGCLRSAGGCLVVVVGLALFAGGMEVVAKRVDERRFPWGYPKPGRATLVGTWVGMLTTGGGARRPIYMDLRLKPVEYRGRRGRGQRLFRSTRSPTNLVGEVRLCGGEAGEQRFDINTGRLVDGGASRFLLGLYPADSVPPDGFAPSHMRGAWNTRDSLAIEADVYLRRGPSAISSGDDPHTSRPASIGMHRGDEKEYQSHCARR